MSEKYYVVYTDNGKAVKEEGPYSREKAQEIADDHNEYADNMMRITHIGFDGCWLAYVKGPINEE